MAALFDKSVSEQFYDSKKQQINSKIKQKQTIVCKNTKKQQSTKVVAWVASKIKNKSKKVT